MGENGSAKAKAKFILKSFIARVAPARSLRAQPGPTVGRLARP